MKEYPHVNSEQILAVKYEERGRDLLIFEDGSKWETSSFRKCCNALLWEEGDTILIQQGRTVKFITYHLKNLDKNETLSAFFRGSR